MVQYPARTLFLHVYGYLLSGIASPSPCNGEDGQSSFIAGVNVCFPGEVIGLAWFCSRVIVRLGACGMRRESGGGGGGAVGGGFGDEGILLQCVEAKCGN